MRIWSSHLWFCLPYAFSYPQNCNPCHSQAATPWGSVSGCRGQTQSGAGVKAWDWSGPESRRSFRGTRKLDLASLGWHRSALAGRRKRNRREEGGRRWYWIWQPFGGNEVYRWRAQTLESECIQPALLLTVLLWESYLTLLTIDFPMGMTFPTLE